MADTLTARARDLADSGTDRLSAKIQLMRAAALGDLDGDTYSVQVAINEAYGPEAQPEPVEQPEPAAMESTGPDGRQDAGEAQALRLPPWRQMRSTNPPRPAPQLIDGLLRRGHVGLLVARAKSNKTWGVISMSVAVATGADWLGFKCTRGRVLFIDPELDSRSLDRRFCRVADAMGADPASVDAGVMKWSLRGVTVRDGGAVRAPTITDVAHDLECMIMGGSIDRGEIALVVIDSCSALLTGDENASGDIRAFFNTCLRIAELTGASVMLVHHEGKAASGDRDAMARGRGSSAWADCPDLVLSLVELFPPGGEPADYLSDGERAFQLEVAAIREFPPVQPINLLWRYPLLTPDADGVSDGWKPKSTAQAAGRTSGDSRRAKAQERAGACTMALLAHMYRNDVDSAEGIPATEAAEICSEALNMTVRTQPLKQYVEDSEWLDVYQRSPQRWAVVPRHPRQKLT